MYLNSSIAFANHGTLSLCNKGLVHLSASLSQPAPDATTDLCSVGAIRVLSSAPQGTSVSLDAGMLKGGGLVEGSLIAGCAVSFQGSVGAKLNVQGGTHLTAILLAPSLARVCEPCFQRPYSQNSSRFVRGTLRL